ncbi:dynein light chain roadblock-type 2 [Drosophila rhopaloa]|uniref:Roadblock/LAMTOR2 domain-containing protein n=1 Tax=Drosophila rhopaloa TaxID=1041015 RepID=A0ABM5JBE3_DRORH|nr:dynein light chain roadblock-type 2 [Drosophila rhopaloa]
MASSNVQTTFDRLVQLPGVVGAILIDGDGVPVRTNMTASAAEMYANRMRPLVTLARSMVHDIEPDDHLSYVRLRTRRQELMVATENQHTIILIQDNQALDESRRNSAASRRASRE